MYCIRIINQSSVQTTNRQIGQCTTVYIFRLEFLSSFQKDWKALKFIQLSIRHGISRQIQINQDSIREQ